MNKNYMLASCAPLSGRLTRFRVFLLGLTRASFGYMGKGKRASFLVGPVGPKGWRELSEGLRERQDEQMRVRKTKDSCTSLWGLTDKLDEAAKTLDMVTRTAGKAVGGVASGPVKVVEEAVGQVRKFAKTLGRNVRQ